MQGWAAHNTLILSLKWIQFGTPWKDDIPIERKSFSADSQMVRATGAHFFSWEGAELMGHSWFRPTAESFKANNGDRAGSELDCSSGCSTTCILLK